MCLYNNVVNEIKPSQLKNCLVLEDMKNTIGCLEKICKMIIKIIANEATELRSEVDSAADYNAAQCGQNPSNSV